MTLPGYIKVDSYYTFVISCCTFCAGKHTILGFDLAGLAWSKLQHDLAVSQLYATFDYYYCYYYYYYVKTPLTKQMYKCTTDQELTGLRQAFHFHSLGGSTALCFVKNVTDTILKL